MKIAIVYFSQTGNTQKVADLIAEGAKKIENVDVKSMSVEEIDNEFLTEAKARDNFVTCSFIPFLSNLSAAPFYGTKP